MHSAFLCPGEAAVSGRVRRGSFSAAFGDPGFNSLKWRHGPAGQDIVKEPNMLLHRMNFLLLIALALAFFGYCYPNPRSQMLESILTWASKVLRKTHGEQGVRLSNMLNLQPDVLIPPRKDVLPVTPCLAPIIWDRAFNTDILNEQFQLQNITIGLTVFVVKKYIST